MRKLIDKIKQIPSINSMFYFAWGTSDMSPALLIILVPMVFIQIVCFPLVKTSEWIFIKMHYGERLGNISIIIRLYFSLMYTIMLVDEFIESSYPFADSMFINSIITFYFSMIVFISMFPLLLWIMKKY